MSINTRVGFHMGAESGLDRVINKNLPIIRHLSKDKDGAYIYYTNEGVPYENGRFAQAHRVIASGDDYMTFAQQNVELDAVRDLTGRLDVETPTVNEPEVIALARDKENFYRLFSDVTAPTVVFDTQNPASLTPALEQLPEGDMFVVKPIIGNESKDVQIVSKSEIDSRLRDELVKKGGKWLFQPFITNRTLDQVGITPLDEGAADQMRLTNKGEIRLFSTSLEAFPLGRVWIDGSDLSSDVYVGLDPDRLPEAAYDLASLCVRRLVELGGNPKHIFAAVDVLYTGQDNSFEGWQIMEANVKEPAIPKHPVVGDKVGEIVAKELLKT